MLQIKRLSKIIAENNTVVYGLVKIFKKVQNACLAALSFANFLDVVDRSS
jgi:hypothetical protein